MVVSPRRQWTRDGRSSQRDRCLDNYTTLRVGDSTSYSSGLRDGKPRQDHYDNQNKRVKDRTKQHYSPTSIVLPRAEAYTKPSRLVLKSS